MLPLADFGVLVRTRPGNAEWLVSSAARRTCDEKKAQKLVV